MSQLVKLGEIADIQTGPFGSQLHQKDYVDSGTPIITVEHLGDDRIKRQNLPLVSGTDVIRLVKYTLRQGDTVFSRVGSVDRASYVHAEEDGWLFSGRCLRVRPHKEKVNARYLSFYLRSQRFLSYIRSVAVGATMPSINTTLLSDAPIVLPESSRQVEIAEVLDSLEQKIHLNRRINMIVEQMNQALFKRWFVDFDFPNEHNKPYKSSGGKMKNSELGLIPEHWNINKLSDHCDIINGASYKSTELKPASTALITLKSIARGGGFKREGYKEFTGVIKDLQVVEDGDVVVAHTDLTQKVEVAGLPAVVSGTKAYTRVGISMDLVKVVPKTRTISLGYLYMILKSPRFQAHKIGYITGSTVLHLNKKCIPDYSLVMPNDININIKFSAYSETILKKVALNEDENGHLEQAKNELMKRMFEGED